MNTTPKFESGQVIHHKRLGYRGVILSVDDEFQGVEQHRDLCARTARDKPWYHVLVDGSEEEAYVAERHLELDESAIPVEHPLIGVFFDELKEGRYVRTRVLN
jgi:heat shock protein HspQ